MYSFVIGAPGVCPDVLSFSGTVNSERSKDLSCLNEDDYRKHLSPYVLFRNGEQSELGKLHLDATRYLIQAAGIGHLLINAPNFLGVDKNLLQPGRPFPLADGRLRRLNELVFNKETVIHLFIVSQVDLILSLKRYSADKRIQALWLSELSWSNIAWRILRSLPSCRLIVWDFEMYALALRAFLDETLLKSYSGEEWEALERQRTISNALTQFAPALELRNVSRCARLDDLYDMDLYKIASLPRTLLKTF
jgi:hypothetical protein